MDRANYLYKFLAITGLVLVLYVAAVNIGLFWIFNWYDSVMHVLGGVAIGYFALWIRRGNSFWFAGILALSIGVAWEIFERVGNYVAPKLLAYGGIGDTLLDIVCAIIGALVVVAISKTKNKSGHRTAKNG